VNIESERLIIRNFQQNDVTNLYEYLSLASTYLFEPGQPISLEEAEILVTERQKTDHFLAVELKTSNKMIGHLYFKQIEPICTKTFELGYIFNPIFQNKGYGTESSKALIKYSFANNDIHRIIANCNPENIASWRLLEKIGMRREGHFLEKNYFRENENNEPIWFDSYQYAILRKEVI
jgi:[ribosomal protein S5]-alanine N-acetyltransferase